MKSAIRHGLNRSSLSFGSVSLVGFIRNSRRGRAELRTRKRRPRPGASVAHRSRKPGELGRYIRNGGEDGIRTHETLLGSTPLAGERLRPLGHLSGASLDKEKPGDNQQVPHLVSRVPVDTPVLYMLIVATPFAGCCLRWGNADRRRNRPGSNRQAGSRRRKSAFFNRGGTALKSLW